MWTGNGGRSGPCDGRVRKGRVASRAERMEKRGGGSESASSGIGLQWRLKYYISGLNLVGQGEVEMDVMA